MFITHYDNSFLDCTNIQFDELLKNTKILFSLFDKYVLESDIIEALYQDDDIYYSAKYLFNSDKQLKDLYKNYCSLARLIFLFYNKKYKISTVEINVITNSMMVGNIPKELIEFYSYSF